jgi:hypothetical protein
MENVKTLFAKKWFWVALAIGLAFLVYHAPRVANSLPFI